MNRRDTLKLVLLAGASVTSLLAYRELRPRAAAADYLDDKQDLLNELAETIIPQTDTPGAKAANVGAFILLVLRECADARAVRTFVAGLQDLEEFSFARHGRSFARCSAPQQEAVLQHFEDSAAFSTGLLGKVRNKLLGQSFFGLLKTYTVQGFCASQVGATQALRYEVIPGRFENVRLPAGPPPPSWATR